MIEWLQDNLGGRGFRKARECAKVSIRVAKELVDTKARVLAEGKGRRDILSLLGKLTVPTKAKRLLILSHSIVKANASQNDATRLNEDEMMSQMR